MVVSDDKEALPLQELCRVFYKYIVSKRGIRVTTRIYAGSALLSLLCYAKGDVGEAAMKNLKDPVEQFLDPAKARGNGNEKPQYFWRTEVLLVERIWTKLKLKFGKEQLKGVKIMSPDGIEHSHDEVLDVSNAV